MHAITKEILPSLSMYVHPTLLYAIVMKCGPVFALRKNQMGIQTYFRVRNRMNFRKLCLKIAILKIYERRISEHIRYLDLSGSRSAQVLFLYLEINSWYKLKFLFTIYQFNGAVRPVDTNMY